jgi:hypothetical protein
MNTAGVPVAPRNSIRQDVVPIGRPRRDVKVSTRNGEQESSETSPARPGATS